MFREVAAFAPAGAEPDQLERANRRLALLAGAASALLRSEQPREYVRDLYDALAEHLGLDAYFNFLVEVEAGRPRLRLDSYAGVPEEVAQDFERLEFGVAVCGVVARDRQARIVDDVQDSSEAVTALIRSLGITAYASYPLLVGDRLVGTLSFGLRSRPAFEADEVELLRVIADQVATAIDRAATRDAERRAREAAEGANEAKSQFLSSMTHELRTPLTAIVGLTELVKTGSIGPVTQQQKLQLDRIMSAAWHLVSMIDQILAFSRSEAGKVEVHREEVDLAAVARDVVGVLTGEAARKGLDLHWRGTEAPRVVHTDAGKVRQVLTNLVGNAIRYTDSGHVEVAIEEEGGWIHCLVRDTGRGIEPGNLESIFQPFMQVKDPETGGDGGTGLGLAVSRRLARLLGGDVAVDSTPGQGSTFVLRLPAE